jgi:hypothetical protein
VSTETLNSGKATSTQQLPSLANIFGGQLASRFRKIAQWRKKLAFSRKHKPARNPVIRIEPLEPRLLLSADVVGALDVPGEVDQYTFTLASDTKVYFDALSANV